MLTTTKSVTLTGQSTIDNQIIATFHANIPSDGNTNKNSSIVNQTLYRQNRSVFRTDETEFDDIVYTIEEQMIAESEAE